MFSPQMFYSTLAIAHIIWTTEKIASFLDKTPVTTTLITTRTTECILTISVIITVAGFLSSTCGIIISPTQLKVNQSQEIYSSVINVITDRKSTYGFYTLDT